MLLSQCRDALRRAVLHAGGRSYDHDKVDSAIQFMGNDFVNYTGCTRTSGTVTISADTNTVDLSSLSGYTTECFRQARIGYTPYLKKRDFDQVLEDIEQCAQTGTPTTISLEVGSTIALLYPTPTVEATLTVFWCPPFTSWTPGAKNPGEITLNIPDRYINNMIWLGAAAAMVDAEADTYYHSAGWKQYERMKIQTRKEFNSNPGGGRIARRSATL